MDKVAKLQIFGSSETPRKSFYKICLYGYLFLCSAECLINCIVMHMTIAKQWLGKNIPEVGSQQQG
jgi:hypothetical protein